MLFGGNLKRSSAVHIKFLFLGQDGPRIQFQWHGRWAQEDLLDWAELREGGASVGKFGNIDTEKS